MDRRRKINILLILLFLILSRAGYSQGMSDLPLYRYVLYLPSSGYVKNSLATPSDLYVFIFAGSSNIDIWLLAQPGQSSAKLTAVLKSSIAGVLASNVQYYSEHGKYTLVRVTCRNDRIGKLKASTVVPVSAILNGLGKAGYHPQLLLETAACAVNNPTLLPVSSTPWNRLYNMPVFANIPVVIVSISLSPMVYLWVLLWFVFTVILNTWLVRVIADNQRRSVHGFYYAAVIQIILIWLLINTHSAAAAADLWFGCSIYYLIAPIMAAPLITAFIIIYRSRQNIAEHYMVIIAGTLAAAGCISLRIFNLIEVIAIGIGIVVYNRIRYMLQNYFQNPKNDGMIPVIKAIDFLLSGLLAWILILLMMEILMGLTLQMAILLFVLCMLVPMLVNSTALLRNKQT